VSTDHSDLPQQFANYELLARVADGGMAELFVALQDMGDAGRRLVTVKRIRPEHVHDPDFIDFFLTESRITLKFAHPNLPAAYEHGCVDGQHFLAMEYIHGHTVLELIRASIRTAEPLSLAFVQAVGTAVASALEHAHDQCDVDGEPLDVVHRDVTPQNIMVSTSGAIKLIDFGIVRSTIQVHRTRTGIVKGKLAYMAPEQLDGNGSLDLRADLFSLGVVLWESLLGRPLFRGKSELQTVDRIRRMKVPDPRQLRPDIPPDLAVVVLKALERDPDRRFATATDMLTALEDAAARSHVYPSTRGLRAEVAALCGIPALPAVPGRTGVPLRAGSAAETDRVSASAAIADVASSPKSGLLADPLLVYFLRQTGARVPGDPSAVGRAPGHDAHS
jgi:serine/threonine protein kinase